MSDTPDDLRYTEDHVWVRIDSTSGVVRVGITDFAQQALGDVIDVHLPDVGDRITRGEPCGEVESTKSVSDVVAPVSGTVRARNDHIAGSPELVNSDPYGDGWLVEVGADPARIDVQLEGVLDSEAYRAVTGG